MVEDNQDEAEVKLWIKYGIPAARYDSREFSQAEPEAFVRIGFTACEEKPELI
ncbi:MAG: hypothetical protein IKE81_11230 [Clostridia bacterium]|nr:hypothetical protein [Clostridia bacterium]